MNGLQQDTRPGKLNIGKLMEEIGLLDPVRQKKVTDLLEGGQITDLKELVARIQSLV